MAIRGPRRERDGSIVYNSHVPLKQPVAQAKRKHRFRFILTEIDKPFFHSCNGIACIRTSDDVFCKLCVGSE